MKKLVFISKFRGPVLIVLTVESPAGSLLPLRNDETDETLLGLETSVQCLYHPNKKSKFHPIGKEGKYETRVENAARGALFGLWE